MTTLKTNPLLVGNSRPFLLPNSDIHILCGIQNKCNIRDCFNAQYLCSCASAIAPDDQECCLVFGFATAFVTHKEFSGKIYKIQKEEEEEANESDKNK